jgi:hypothetical protein
VTGTYSLELSEVQRQEKGVSFQTSRKETAERAITFWSDIAVVENEPKIILKQSVFERELSASKQDSLSGTYILDLSEVHTQDKESAFKQAEKGQLRAGTYILE